MRWLFAILMIGSFVCAVFCGKMEALSLAASNAAANGVQLALSLLGSMAFWSGIMQIAEDSKLTDHIARLLSKPVRWLFWGLTDAVSIRFICMNITANLLGLGNAATPLGLRAMKRLDEIGNHPTTPTRHMSLFTVINTASLQLIPTTVAMLRGNYGSKAPFSILPASVLTSACALLVVIGLVKPFCHPDKEEENA